VVVHAFPSSQLAVLFAFTHPVDGLQESVVHTFPSLQSSIPPPTHAPPEQVSVVVHAFPSSQLAVLFAFTHPVDGLHESSVHTFPSLHINGVPPWQVPDTQVSVPLHTFPSSHSGSPPHSPMYVLQSVVDINTRSSRRSVNSTSVLAPAVPDSTENLSVTRHPLLDSGNPAVELPSQDTTPAATAQFMLTQSWVRHPVLSQPV